MVVQKTKERLDKLLVNRGFAPTREKARALIMAGSVLVRGERIDKAGHLVGLGMDILVTGDNNPYVSRGGLKLKGALDAFSLSVADDTALDVGASTGGFTDCLIQAGAKKVYALDVGYGQLAWKLRTDKRVTIIERANIRYYSGEEIVDPVDLATIDTSFISLKLVIPAAMKYIRPEGCIISLIKPQFEAGRTEVGKRGVVKNPEIHKRVVEEIILFCRDLGLEVRGTCESPLTGPQGNREYFLLAINSRKK